MNRGLFSWVLGLNSLTQGLGCRPCHIARSGAGDTAGMDRPDLLIGFLAFGAAVMTLWAWLWSNLSQREP